MFYPKSIRLAVGVIAVLGNWVQAQEAPSVQQAQAECQSIAQQQTGYNPNAAATTQQQANRPARGAATGAMAGAVKGKSKSNQYSNVPDNVAEEYTRNQVQDAAKMGVAAGASRQRQERRQSAKSQNSSATAYNQAYSSCMAARIPWGIIKAIQEANSIQGKSHNQVVIPRILSFHYRLKRKVPILLDN